MGREGAGHKVAPVSGERQKQGGKNVDMTLYCGFHRKGITKQENKQAYDWVV